MERKLVKQGRNALTVTLPAKWLKAKRLKAGDSVDVIEKNTELIIKTERAVAQKTVTLDLRDAERNMMFHIVRARYIEGYDTMILLHSNTKTVQDIAQGLIGVVLAEHSSSHSVLKSVIATPEDTFDALLRRAAHLLVEETNTLLSVAEKKATADDVRSVEHLLDTNLLYCMRYLNKYENIDHSYRYFLLCSTIEEAGDYIKTIAKHIGRNKKLAQLLAETIDEYIICLFTKNFRKAFSVLRTARGSIATGTFVDGLVYSLVESLYNFLGYLVDEKV